MVHGTQTTPERRGRRLLSLVLAIAALSCGAPTAARAPAPAGTNEASRLEPPLRAGGTSAKSKIDATKRKLNRYAFEAYPEWAVSHLDAMCPENLADVGAYIPDEDGNDAWGRPIRMLCGPTLPAGAKGFAVVSLGPDGREATEDDVKSWE
jgi:hypothetical protein